MFNYGQEFYMSGWTGSAFSYLYFVSEKNDVSNKIYFRENFEREILQIISYTYISISCAYNTSISAYINISYAYKLCLYMPILTL